MRTEKVSIHMNGADGVSELFVHCESHELSYNPDSETYKVIFVDGVSVDDETGNDGSYLIEKITIGKQVFGFIAVTTPAPDDAETQALADEAEAGYDPNKLIPRRTPGTENLAIKPPTAE